MATAEQAPEAIPHDRSVEDPLAQVRKVRETSERMANGETPEEADQTRVLAGLIHQLAEQVERLHDPVTGQRQQADEGKTAIAPGTNPPRRVDHEAEIAVEEDQTPEDAPADPIDDRADT